MNGIPRPRPRDPAAERGETYRVRLREPGDVAAALPHLLGFHPRESVVAVSLTGPTGDRVGLTARVDIPPPAAAPALARTLTRSLLTDDPGAVLLAVVSDADDAVVGGTDAVVGGTDAVAGGAPAGADAAFPDRDLPHRRLVHELVLAVSDVGLPVQEALLVRRGRWWSYDCPHACCAPGAGTPLPAGVGELAVASVAAGAVVAADRDELLARIAPPDGPAAAAMAAAVLRAGHEAVGSAEGGRAEGGREGAAAAAWRAISAAAARCGTARRPAEARLSDAEVAGVVWALRDLRVRDRALGLSLGADPAAAERLWTECTRRAPAPLDAAPATLLAVAAWLRGDGAMARIALERALRSEPGYALADLLARGLAACLPPAELSAMIAGTLLELRADDSGGPSGPAAGRRAGVRGALVAATPRRGRARRGRR